MAAKARRLPDRVAVWNDDPELLEAIAEIERGEGIVVTDITAYFDGIERRATEAARGDEVPDNLKY